MPMPAANSIANQDNRENSGLASIPPIRILPTGIKIRARQSTTNRLALSRKPQSNTSMAPFLALSSSSFAPEGKISVATTNATIRKAVRGKTML